MKFPCFYCDEETDTKKEDIMVVVGWCLEELLEKNNLKIDKPVPRMVHICPKCWNDRFKEKLDKEGYHWIYSKDI
jgi:hypothetical protein